MKKCPYCSEQIQDVAKKCRFCGEWLESQSRVSQEPQPKQKKEQGPSNVSPSTGQEKKEWNIKYGSATIIDKFGFVGTGKIGIAEEAVELSGKKHWSAMARFGVFLAITFVPLILFGFGLGFLLALVVIHYFCASPGIVTLSKDTIKEVKRKNKRIEFLAHEANVDKQKRSLFNARSEEEAREIETALLNNLVTFL